MIKLNLSFPNNRCWLRIAVFSALFVSLFLSTASAQTSGGDFTITKDLITSGGGGSGIQGSGFTLDFSVGEPIAGYVLSDALWSLSSGYLSGRTGAGQALSIRQISVGGLPRFYQSGLQVGVTIQAPVQITFSDALDLSSVADGLSVAIRLDHLGQVQNTLAPTKWSYDPSGPTLTLLPQTAWQGNTLYDVVINPQLLSGDGYTLESSTHALFQTALDPQQDNVVLTPLNLNDLMSGTFPSAGLGGFNLTMSIPRSALSNYAMILFNPDPVNNPLQTDPSVLRDANAQAEKAGGPYRTPVAFGEIAAYDLDGRPLQTLAFPAQASMSFNEKDGLLTGPSVPVRSGTLSLWALDTTHHLWVKMPSSHIDPSAKTVTAPITRFSVYSLMGGAEGSASDVYVFPTPWRPHGPNAGDGPGQTGSEAGGMTFNNLPSECRIRIYTLGGEQVRELHHSDVSGALNQEKWDGLTAHGSPAASGVYLWRVESSVDGKNGKLMIIR